MLIRQITPKLLEEFSCKIEAECWYLSTVCAMQHQHQGWVKNSFGERNCGAVTFGPTAHCILQLLPLSYGVTMDDSSWMQQQKITLVHFFLKFCISLSCQRRKNEKKKVSDSQHIDEIWSWLAFTRLQRDYGKFPPNQTTMWKRSHQTTLSAILKK